MRLAEWAQAQGIDRAHLIAFTHDIIDTQLALLSGLPDAAVPFAPEDPDADDPFATEAGEQHVGWTLGHIIAHVTASSEECCAHAAALARGVTPCGRDRYETPWQEVDAVAAARQRLQESRRIRLAYLDAWPDRPHLETTYTPYGAPQNCITRVLAGLFHEEGHLDQMREAIRQATASALGGNGLAGRAAVSTSAAKPSASRTI
ncbi:MAG: DinB family protein [Caldilineales bacterium]|nr:DinB family protein [Caldilineales bacterium]